MAEKGVSSEEQSGELEMMSELVVEDETLTFQDWQETEIVQLSQPTGKAPIPLCPGAHGRCRGRDDVLSVLCQIYQRFGEEKNPDQDLYKALEVKTKNGKKSSVFLNTGVNLTPTSQKMQMSYPSPINEATKNYSLVWILTPIPPGGQTNYIPFLPPFVPVRNELGIDLFEDQPHYLSNFVAPKAFLHVDDSGTQGTFDIYFEDGDDADAVYFKKKGDVYAMWTVYTDKKANKQFLYSILPSPTTSPKADPNQIEQIYAINQGAIERPPKQPWPPQDTYVWTFTKDFTVVNGSPIEK